MTKARQVDELVAEVAGASREQTQGITQINSAVGQMDKVTQANAANAEESAAAAEELNAQAETMKRSVGDLLRLVNANGVTFQAKPLDLHSNAKKTRRSTTVSRQPEVRHINGNGREKAAPALEAATSRGGEIPMEDDFKNF